MANSRPQELFASHLLLSRLARARHIADPGAGFLAEIAAQSICERLSVVNREFEKAVDLFSRSNHLAAPLKNAKNVGSITHLGGVSLNSSDEEFKPEMLKVLGGKKKLPLESDSVNLVVSLFGLHWSNDLPGLLAQIRSVLAPDGLFMCALPGDRTLLELRECLIEAESRLTGSASLRVDPVGEVRQYGNLLQRAGFALPVADSETITARYGSLAALVKDLRAMGATSVLSARKAPASRKTFELCEEIYFERFGDPDNKIRATFEIVQLSGWAPHSSQQKPLKPGSAIKPLKDVLGTQNDGD